MKTKPIQPNSQVSLRDIAEFLCACHLSRLVDAQLFDSCGGIGLVSSSGSLKTSLLRVLERYSDFIGISDLTVRGLHEMKEAMVDGKLATMGFYEIGKLYARRVDVAASMEMAMMALMDEGLGQPNWVDQSVSVTRAKCMVMGAMTRSFYNDHISEWKNGFSRRMIFLHYSISDPWATAKAVVDWAKIPLSMIGMPEMPTEPIPFAVTKAERVELLEHLSTVSNEDHTLHLAVAAKALAVMKWNDERNRRKRDAMAKLKSILRMCCPEPIIRVTAEPETEVDGDGVEKRRKS